MMYQRDIMFLAQQAEQRLDDRVERRVGAEEEDGEEGGHDHDHDRALDGLLPARPHDLRRFRANLVEKRLGADLRHFPHLRKHAERSGFPGPESTKRKTWSLYAPGLKAAGLAGVEGLEPPALGFGDRCSTS